MTYIFSQILPATILAIYCPSMWWRAEVRRGNAWVDFKQTNEVSCF